MKRHIKNFLVLCGFVLLGYALVAVASYITNVGATVIYR